MKSAVLAGVVLLLAGCSGGDDGKEPGGSGGKAPSGGNSSVAGTTSTSDGGEPASVGGSANSGGSTGGAPVVPECRGPGADCSDDEQACCDGSSCIHDVQTNAATCADHCRVAADCKSGCCAPLLDDAVSVCSAPKFCASACLQAGGDCSSAPTLCCADTICVNQAVGAACAAKCTINTDCSSGCCATLQNGGKACAPADICQ